ncbi:MAG: hypothetical protein U0Z17_11690 [Bacteroidales bacterium]
MVRSFRIGLPGVSAIVLVNGIFTNIYSMRAVLSLLQLLVNASADYIKRCCIARFRRNAVMNRTGLHCAYAPLSGSPGSFGNGWMLNPLMPGSISPDVCPGSAPGTFGTAFMHWFNSILRALPSKF